MTYQLLLDTTEKTAHNSFNVEVDLSEENFKELCRIKTEKLSFILSRQLHNLLWESIEPSLGNHVTLQGLNIINGERLMINAELLYHNTNPRLEDEVNYYVNIKI